MGRYPGIAPLSAAIDNSGRKNSQYRPIFTYAASPKTAMYIRHSTAVQSLVGHLFLQLVKIFRRQGEK